MRVLIALVFCMFSINLFSASESGNIKGKVIDKITKRPLIGANVVVQGTKAGSATDSLGVYSIENIPESVYILNFSYLGYENTTETEIRVIRGKTTYVN